MALTARGVLNAWDWAERKQQLKEAEMNQKEALAFELAAKYGMGNISGLSGTKSGKSKAGATSMGIALKTLQTTYGIDDTALVPIIASGDKTGPGKLLKVLEEQRVKYGELGLDLPDQVINEIVESAVTTQPTTKELDFTEIENYIGREMDSMLKSVLQAGQTTPGSVFVPEYAFVEKPTFADLDSAIKYVATSQKDGATSEIAMLDRAIGKINKQETITPAQQNYVALLTQRKQRVEKALDNFTDDPLQLVNLYGNSYAIKLQKEFPNYEGLLPDTLTDPTRQYMSVASPEMAIALLKAGIIEDGTMVRLPDGTELPVRMNRE